MRYSLAIVGCGNICEDYLSTLKQYPNLVSVSYCYDIDNCKSAFISNKYGIKSATSLHSILNDETVDIILNITPPKEHFEISMLSLSHRKYVFSEKPFTLSSKEANELLRTALKFKRWICSAPDTMIAPSFQKVKKIIEQNKIGIAVSANVSFLSKGHESWHPNPDFFYECTGGPLWDMGTYYVGALIMLFGSIKSVFANGKKTFNHRNVIKDGVSIRKIKVDTYTHISAQLVFQDGLIATLTSSFDVSYPKESIFEIYGTEGTLICSDPNEYHGNIVFWDGKKKKIVQPAHVFQGGFRGLGLIEMIHSIKENRNPILKPMVSFHTIDVIESIFKSINTGKNVVIKTKLATSDQMLLQNYNFK